VEIEENEKNYVPTPRTTFVSIKKPDATKKKEKIFETKLSLLGKSQTDELSEIVQSISPKNKEPIIAPPIPIVPVVINNKNKF
jgi:hypothetical protein